MSVVEKELLKGQKEFTKKQVEWSADPKDTEYPRANKLILKQIMLGVEAKEGEYNVVEVETPTNTDKHIKIPIAVLKVGELRVSQSFLEFPDSPVTFKLIQGSGPVHIHGHHLLGEYEMEDEEDEDLAEAGEDEQDEDEEIEEASDDGENPKKKMKLSAKPIKNSKGGKKK